MRAGEVGKRTVVEAWAQAWAGQPAVGGLLADELHRGAIEAGIGLFDWDVARGQVIVDSAAARLLGLGDYAGPTTTDAAMAAVHPEERAAVREARDAALRANAAFLEEYRVVQPDGSVTWVRTRSRVLVDAQTGRQHVVGVCTDRSADQSVRDRVTRALDYMGDIILVLDETDTIVHANHEAVRQFRRARTEIIGRPASDVLTSPVREYVAEIRRRRAEQTAPQEVFEVEEADPDGMWWAVRMFSIPDGLVVAMRDVDARHRADAERKQLIGSLSAALRRSRQLLDGTAALGLAFTVDDLCDVTAKVAQSDLGVLFVGLVLLEESGAPRVVSRPHSPLLTDVWRRMPESGPAATPHILRSGKARFDESRTSYLRDFPDRAPNMDAAGIEAMATIPLIVSGRPIGVLVFGWPEPHDFVEEERRFMLTLVGPFAQAVERARLYERQMSTVETLQRAVLPETLPGLDGVRLAARYLPAGRDVGIGGDWYDATVLRDGSLSLVVGDVGGHGLRAVSTMAELRHAARAYALELRTPAAITTQLSANLYGGADAPLATVVVANLVPASGLVTWSCAGHPPPLLLPGDGDATVRRPGHGVSASGPTSPGTPPVAGARFLEEVHGPILGVQAGVAYGQSVVRLGPGAGLLLYTDGLVERRGSSLAERLDDLADSASVPGLTADDLCDHILRTTAPPDRVDDLCLLAALIPDAGRGSP
jgi:PAS domain S-box-containing protein